MHSSMDTFVLTTTFINDSKFWFIRIILIKPINFDKLKMEKVNKYMNFEDAKNMNNEDNFIL